MLVGGLTVWLLGVVAWREWVLEYRGFRMLFGWKLWMMELSSLGEGVFSWVAMCCFWVVCWGEESCWVLMNAEMSILGLNRSQVLVRSGARGSQYQYGMLLEIR